MKFGGRANGVRWWPDELDADLVNSIAELMKFDGQADGVRRWPDKFSVNLVSSIAELIEFNGPTDEVKIFAHCCLVVIQIGSNHIWPYGYTVSVT